MENLTLISTVFFIFWITRYLTVTYLDFRNATKLNNHRSEVPNEFKEIISLAEHQKAIDYTLSKLKFTRFNRIIDNIILAFLLPLGGANFFLILASSFSFTPLVTGLVFFGMLGLGQFFISTPLNFYFHFVIEQKFGFNKMTYKIFIIDLFKQVFISILLGGLLLTMVLFIMENVSSWWLWAWLSTFAFQLLTILIYPSFIAPLFNKFTPMEDAAYLDEINQLTQKTNFPAKELFVMDASIRSAHGNAYFTGFGKNKKIVFFDTLLNILNPKEVKAVLAHEIGHYKHKHILKSLIKMFILSGVLFYLLSILQKTPSFYLGHFVGSISSYSTLFLFFTLLPLYTFWLAPISNFFSRKNEYQADDFAKNHANAEDLISALLKLYKENASPVVIDEVYAQFYYSHPPAIQRIKNLRLN